MATPRVLMLHLKSLMRTPRAYANAWRVRLRQGHEETRWSQEESFNPQWDARTALMGAMVPAGSRVLEFGSGREQLAQFLPAGCHYQPSDLVARSPQTLVWNLNDGFPPLTEQYDVIVFSGVIEYVKDLPALFAAVRKTCRLCIVSYARTDELSCMATRLASGWVNHLSAAELEQIFTRAGFTMRERMPWQHQTLYRLE